MVEPLATNVDFNALPVDETFLGLLADYYAQHHLFVADGEGALSVERILKSDPPLKGRRTVVYADTGKFSHRHVERLARIPGIELQIESTVLGLIRWIAALDLNAHTPTRIYASGSRLMLQLVCEVAERGGIVREAVLRDVRCTAAQRIQCLPCSTIFLSTDRSTSCCSKCGTILRIQPHYDFVSGSYLGTPLR